MQRSLPVGTGMMKVEERMTRQKNRNICILNYS